MTYTAVILGLCQFLYMTVIAIGLSFNSLIAKQMAPSADWVTLPFLFLMGTTAALILKLPQLFSYYGYRTLFIGGALAGIAGGIFSSAAIYLQHFWLLCVAGAFIGIYQATAMYYRFAAADAVAPSQKSTAIARVLTGGILAALLGKYISNSSLHWLPTDYLGSYLVSSCLALLAIPLMAIVPLPKRDAPIVNGVKFSLSQLNLVAFKAILFCSFGYLVMAMVMLASPLAMTDCGFHAKDAASVIQWHLLGMFAPSLITGKLIGRFGEQPIAFTGVGILLLGCVLAMFNQSLIGFHIALAVVGVGWNFMYMGGSTLLTLIEDAQLRGKLQSLNEFTTFSTTTVIAGATGWLFISVGWFWILIAGGIILISVGALVFFKPRPQAA